MIKQNKWRLSWLTLLGLFLVAALSGGDDCFAKEEALFRTENSARIQERALVQGITEESEWEGMLELGLLETKKLAFEDLETAIDTVKNTAVKLRVAGYAGSGSIFEIEMERMIIVSNKHVLMYDSEVEVTLPEDFVCKGEVIGLSEQYDIGFVEVNITDIPYPVRKELRKVKLDFQAAESLTYGTAVFLLGSADERAGNQSTGFITDPWEYIVEFQSFMLHSYCAGKPGMSGGGTFDAYGNFLGMITGGRGEETVSMPLSIIYEEFINL